MVRNYKIKTQHRWEDENMATAAEAIQDRKVLLQRVADTFDVPMVTPYRRMKKGNLTVV
jgi:hypothetical protein